PFPEIASQGMMLGTVQLPASGEPIIMMAEHQTTGGYPRLAEVIRSAQTKLAQLKPGQQIRLNPVSLNEADAINLHADEELHTTITAIQSALGDKP
ncbi:MAG: carboxylase, partial [Polynucleobacter sp.]